MKKIKKKVVVPFPNAFFPHIPLPSEIEPKFAFFRICPIPDRLSPAVLNP